MVVSLGAGTHVFQLDKGYGEFVLSRQRIQMPARGQSKLHIERYRQTNFTVPSFFASSGRLRCVVLRRSLETCPPPPCYVTRLEIWYEPECWFTAQALSCALCRLRCPTGALLSSRIFYSCNSLSNTFKCTKWHLEKTQNKKLQLNCNQNNPTVFSFTP